jgi:hypothetical protein
MSHKDNQMGSKMIHSILVKVDLPVMIKVDNLEVDQVVAVDQEAVVSPV